MLLNSGIFEIKTLKVYLSKPDPDTNNNRFEQNAAKFINTEDK